MKNSINLKEDLEDFISSRLANSQKVLLKRKDYRKQYQKCSDIDNNFICKIEKDKDITNYYFRLKVELLDLHIQDMREAYLTGFKDSIMFRKDNNPIFKIIYKILFSK